MTQRLLPIIGLSLILQAQDVKRPVRALQFFSEMRSDSWETRRDGFLELRKIADPKVTSVRAAVFALLQKENELTTKWMEAKEPAPEAWADPYYPEILGFIEQNYFSSLTPEEFRIVALSNMNHESPFAQRLSMHAEGNLPWLVQASASQSFESRRVNLRWIVAHWFVHTGNPTPEQRRMVSLVFEQARQDPSPFAVTQARRAFARIESKPAKP